MKKDSFQLLQQINTSLKKGEALVITYRKDLFKASAVLILWTHG